MSLNVEHLPQALGSEAAVAWDNILERAGDELSRLLADAASEAAVSQQLPRVLACSPFVADLSRRQPQLLLELLPCPTRHGSSRIQQQ